MNKDDERLFRKIEVRIQVEKQDELASIVEAYKGVHRHELRLYRECYTFITCNDIIEAWLGVKCRNVISKLAVIMLMRVSQFCPPENVIYNRALYNKLAIGKVINGYTNIRCMQLFDQRIWDAIMNIAKRKIIETYRNKRLPEDIGRVAETARNEILRHIDWEEDT